MHRSRLERIDCRAEIANVALPPSLVFVGDAITLIFGARPGSGRVLRGHWPGKQKTFEDWCRNFGHSFIDFASEQNGKFDYVKAGKKRGSRKLSTPDWRTCRRTRLTERTERQASPVIVKCWHFGIVRSFSAYPDPTSSICRTMDFLHFPSLNEVRLPHH